MKDCPRCSSPLVDRATACRCGWRKPAEPVDAARPEAPRVGCSTGCGNAANLSLMIEGNRTPFCARCAEERSRQSAREYLASAGLERREGESLKDWVARQRVWAVTNSRNIGKGASLMREPGEDSPEDINGKPEPILRDPVVNEAFTHQYPDRGEREILVENIL